MQNPVTVILFGPSTEIDPFAEGDIRFLVTLLECCGYRVVGYRGHWNAFHYGWYVVSGQS